MYDIAIIGAGPAGATFAREICKQGKSVLLVNGQSLLNKKPCGGLLAPDAQKLLATFDFTLPKEVLVDPQIFSVKTIDLCSKQVRYYPRSYINMDRKRFDDYLLDMIKQDVTIINGMCFKILKNSENDFEIEVKTKDETKNFKAHYIVGSDGANSIVRRTFYPKSFPKQYVAIQQWFKYEGDQTQFYSCIFDPKTSDSCSWTIHKDSYLIFGGSFNKHNCRKMFDLQK